MGDTGEDLEDLYVSGVLMHALLSRLGVRDLGDGRVLCWGFLETRAAGSGVEMDVPVGGLFEVREGKVTRWEDFGSKEKALDAAASPG